MNGLKFVRYLILLSPLIVCAQEGGVRTNIQKISTGALYYEYHKHHGKMAFPTIVFESGALNSSSYWDPLIDSISKHANTIRYDRAGLGRSLPSNDTIRSTNQIAKELNELLDSLKVEDKFILVCHSAGGFYGRSYAHQYGNRVKALVLIESPCTEWESLLRSSLTKMQNDERDASIIKNRRGLSFFQQKEYQAADINRTILEQIPIMDIPVFIIYGRSHQWPEGYNADLLSSRWKDCQESLGDISSNSKAIVVNGAGHHIFQRFDLPQFLKSIITED